MAGVRSEGQKQVIVLMREEFLGKIDAAMSRLGFNDRASLIREAVYQMLEKAGVEVSPEDKTAPGRAGKGGRPKATKLAAVKDDGKRKQA
jgi:hypothetical protein